jgi:UDP-glucose 4-epimerase
MNNPYSISKTTVERFCNMYRKEHGTRINQVRAVNAYGPLQAAAPPFAAATVRKITPSFVCRALSGMPIEVYGNGEQVSDMVWVGDVAETMVKMLEQGRDDKVYDFVVEAGPKTNHTVNQVAQVVIDTVVSKGYDPVEIVHLPMRPGEVEGDKVTADTTTLERVGIDPESFTELQNGIEKTVDWFIQEEGRVWKRP